MTDAQEPQKSRNGAFIAVILLLLIGLGLMFYLLYAEKSQVEDCQIENKKLNDDMEGMNKMLEGYVGNMSNDLKTDFKNMLQTYDALMDKDKGKTKELIEQKARVEQLMKELETSQRNGSITARQLFELREENKTLRKIMKGYVVQIDSLNTLNLRLENDLDSTSTQLTLTQEDRDRLKQETAGQQEVINSAKKLSAYSINSGALKYKLNGTTTETTKARNTVQLKCAFTIGENSVADAGKLVVYMQIIGPDGKTLQSRASNIVSTSAGKVPYSDKNDKIDYQNRSVDGAVYYSLDGKKIEKGNYKVRLYCRGELIGTDSFTLK